MKTTVTNPAFRLRRLVFFCVFGLLGLRGSVNAEEFDALYLRDGSILKGIILKDIAGNYLVYTPFGELSVGAGEVIYTTSRDKTSPVIQETYIFIGKTSDTISIVEQDVPERREQARSFNLLVPGAVETILTADGDEVLFESRLVGENSLVTINYADLPAKVGRIRITLWRIDLLTSLDGESAKFEQNYTPDREGMVSVMVKYPKEWTVRSVTPPPARRFDGLICWRQALRRQQGFAPQIVFQFTKNPSMATPNSAVP
jgi:hypothetical protein